MAGGVPKFVPLRLSEKNETGPMTSASLHLDFDELEKAVTKKTKILILNNPHNPTGKVSFLFFRFLGGGGGVVQPPPPPALARM